MFAHRRQYHVLVVVVLGAVGQESGGPSAMANNPEVSLVGLTNRILFPMRGCKYGRCSKRSATTSLSTLIITLLHTHTHLLLYVAFRRSNREPSYSCPESPLV